MGLLSVFPTKVLEKENGKVEGILAASLFLEKAEIIIIIFSQNGINGQLIQAQ